MAQVHPDPLMAKADAKHMNKRTPRAAAEPAIVTEDGSFKGTNMSCSSTASGRG